MRKLTAALLVSAALGAAETPSAIAIRDARIYTVSGPVIAAGTVVLRNGLIEAAGPNVQPPPDAWVINGQGLNVYPGLIDALSTWGLAAPAAASANRIAPAVNPAVLPSPAAVQAAAAPNPAGIRGPEDRPATSSWLVAVDQLNPADRRIETFRSAGFTSAVAFPTSGVIAGQGSVMNLAGEKAGEMMVASPAGQYVSMRTAGGSGSFPGSLFGVIAYVRQVCLDADQYKLAREAYDKHPRGTARPPYDRALEGMLASPRLLLPASRAVEIARMSRFAAELKRAAILYGGHEAYKDPAAVKYPLLVSLKWPEKPRDADPEEAEPLRTLELRDQAPSTPAALEKAGVKYAFYSDGIDKPGDLMKAVRRAITAGLTAEQALRAMTLSPAEIFEVADRLGSIEKGKIANLVVTKGDLFSEKPEIQFVFVDGKKYDPIPEVPANETR